MLEDHNTLSEVPPQTDEPPARAFLDTLIATLLRLKSATLMMARSKADADDLL